MLLLFLPVSGLAKADQLGLFDTPVNVRPHVRKDGVVVKPHVRIQKKRIETQQSDLFGHSPPAGTHNKPDGKLEVFIRKHGGPSRLLNILEGLSQDQREQILAGMAKVAKQPPDELLADLRQRAQGESAPTTHDLFTEDHGGVTDIHGPKEGDTKTEDGIEYRLKDGRWHRVTPDDEPRRYGGFTAEEMAEVASRHGFSYEEALRKIKDRIDAGRPGVWINQTRQWLDVEKAVKKQNAKLRRDDNWKPNEKQERVLRLIRAKNRFFIDDDMPMRGDDAKSTQTLINRGVVSRIEFDDQVEYRITEDRLRRISRQPEFQATHTLSSGAPVKAHPAEPGVWIDAHGGEWEDENASPISSATKAADGNTAKPPRSAPTLTPPGPVSHEESLASTKESSAAGLIAARFGLTKDEVKAIVKTPWEELRRRDQYIPPSDTDAPTDDWEKFPIGSAKIGLYGDPGNAYVDVLRTFDPNQVDPTEHEDGIRSHPTFQRYVEWWRQGHEAPPVSVSPGKNGRYNASNRRRVLTAREAGVSRIHGWLSLDNPETGLPLKYGDVMSAWRSETTAEPDYDASETGFGVVSGTSKAARKRLNQQALDILDRGGPYGDADKEILRQYSGTGGIGDSLNEYYTLPSVAAAMWSAIERMGLPSNAQVLEPSSGPGVFLHTAPVGARVTGVELDSTSSAISEILHSDRHEVRNSSFERFATTDNRQFDAVIGNAPFGLRGALINDDKPFLPTAEQYFIDTALDKTKAGGIVAMIVPTGIMDGSNTRKFRERMLRKAEFMGAIRLPNTAFEHAHTGVTTDIVFLRKRPDDVASALMVVRKAHLLDLGVWDESFLAGVYLSGRGAPNVLGTLAEGWRAKAGMGQDFTVEGSMEGVPDAIGRWMPEAQRSASPDVPAILAAVGDDENLKAKVLGATVTRPYQVTAKAGDTKTVDGVLYVLTGHPPRWHRIDEWLASDKMTAAASLAMKIAALIEWRDNGMPRGEPEPAWLKTISDEIKAWVDEHGIPVKDPDLQIAARNDKRFYRLIGSVSREGELSDLVRSIQPDRPAGTLQIVAQSLVLERDSRDFSVDEVAARLDADRDEIEDILITSPDYANSGDRWTTMDEYLTGDLWQKYDAAHAAMRDAPADMKSKLEAQIKRLDEAIDPKLLDDIEIQLNSGWIPLEILSEFLTEQNKNSGNEWRSNLDPIQISFKAGVYYIQGGNKSDLVLKALDKYLNRTGLRKDDVPWIDELAEEFRTWLCASRYRDQVEELYNRKFRGFVDKKYSDSPMEIPGMATGGLKSYQWSGLRWALAAGRGIIAADVGLGKTVRALMLARMLKLTGKAKRPMISVPKSVLANWYAECEKWFPGARALTIGATFERQADGSLKGRDDTAAERKRKYHALTQNEYDFILISEPSFEELDLDPMIKFEMNQQDFWVQRGQSLGQDGDKRTRKIREAWDQARAQREVQNRTDAVYFNDLGVDAIIVDEAHHMKNLVSARGRFGETPKFLGGQGLSNRALDFNLKARWILQQTGNKNVYGLTATPTKNSPLEIYSMLSHVAPDEFLRLGIRNSEDFIDRFCVFDRDNVLDTSGEIELDALVTVGFKNLDELRELMRRHIDRKTAADVGLVLPDRDDRIHFIEMSPAQQEVYAELRDRLQKSSLIDDASGEDHIFSIMDKMNKAAMDLEILDPVTHKGQRSPKYQAAAKVIAEGIKDGGQVVFSDYVDSHEKIRDALVRAGIPREQIAILNAKVASSSTQRQNISEAFNAGKLKVVIGNTAVMGEGVNLQKGTTDIHHLDLPWEPASVQQRNGRGLRQGNVSAAVRIHSYLAKGSFDGYRWQSVNAKKDWQDLLWSGGDRVENLARSNLTREDMLCMMAADPDAAREALAANRKLAGEKMDAAGREKVAGEFVKFKSLATNYKKLSNKTTKSALQLKDRIDQMKFNLRRNRYLSERAKRVIDSDIPCLINPSTGAAFHDGSGFRDANGDRWVVTHVSGTEQISARRYGDPNSVPHVFALKKTDGFTEFDFDENDEADEIHRKLQESILGDGKIINNVMMFKHLPAEVIKQNQAQIQEKLKTADKSFELDKYEQAWPMVHKETGKIEIPQYFDRKALHDTHDFLLPTQENLARLLETWKNEERAVKFGAEYVNARRSSRSEYRPKRQYPSAGYSNRSVNPYESAIREMVHDGNKNAQEDMARLREEFTAEQLLRIRRAPNFRAALHAMMPTGNVKGGSNPSAARVIYPEIALATAWAKAIHEGVLQNPIEQYEPKNEIGGLGKHDAYAFHHAASGKVQNALYRMALGSGHRKLAVAMMTFAVRRGHMTPMDAFKTMAESIARHEANPHELRTLLSWAEQAGVADDDIGKLRYKSGLFGPKRQAYYGSGMESWSDGTVRNHINNMLQFIEKKEAA